MDALQERPVAITEHRSNDLFDLTVSHLSVGNLTPQKHSLRVGLLGHLLRVQGLQLVGDENLGVVLQRLSVLDEDKENEELDDVPGRNRQKFKEGRCEVNALLLGQTCV